MQSLYGNSVGLEPVYADSKCGRKMALFHLLYDHVRRYVES